MLALNPHNLQKLREIPSLNVLKKVFDAIHLCKPDSVFICTGDSKDIAYIREMAIKSGEESHLKIKGHTVHFDGPEDQARDVIKTKYLVPREDELGTHLNQTDRNLGLEEINSFFRGSMKGKEMIVRFFCLGPLDSPFSILCLQITDSFYVAHSDDLLYREAYNSFRKINDSDDFFFILHSAGRLSNHVSKDVDKRRVYIDYTTNTVLSINTQYAGNTVGFKKLALRLAIRKADQEGWLAEHDFFRTQLGPNGRETFFLGAFPSACGKTSTAMAPGGRILGDDLTYLKVIDGRVRAVNVESGIFGIIRDVNKTDDPVIWEALNSPGEVIFSNVLINEKNPYWLEDGRIVPDQGINYNGKWFKGIKDKNGRKIPHAHSNARYTIRMSELSNLDPKLNDPQGVKVDAIIYGGRDSDTSVPVIQSFDWDHGVITMAASLESESTSATLGQEGVRKFQPMSNIDFVSIPLGKYISNHLNFVKGVDKDKHPKIFGVNYFLKDLDGNYLNGMEDKQVWLAWIELRIHKDVSAIKTPIGFIPKYDDLFHLFSKILVKEYQVTSYEQQFSLRFDKILEKIDRIESIYRESVPETPNILFEVLKKQKEKINESLDRFGKCITPEQFNK